jgi:hypothetical protein
MGEAPDMGGDMEGLGNEGENGMEPAQEGSMPTAEMGNDENAPMESRYSNKPLINEQNNKLDEMFNRYLSTLKERKEKHRETEYKRASVYDEDSLLINEEFDKMIDELGKFIDKE